MTPNGYGTIQGMPPNADVEAIAQKIEETLLEIFNKHGFDYYQAKYVLDKMINLEELRNDNI